VLLHVLSSIKTPNYMPELWLATEARVADINSHYEINSIATKFAVNSTQVGDSWIINLGCAVWLSLAAA